MCFHDPLYYTHYTDWDNELPEKAADGSEVGIACTGIWRWVEWLNQHPAKKVILHRDLNEINVEMHALGLPTLSYQDKSTLIQVNGLHVPHKHLFDENEMPKIWRHLTRNAGTFPAFRHRELVKIQMQPDFEGLEMNRDVTNLLTRELFG